MESVLSSRPLGLKAYDHFPVSTEHFFQDNGLLTRRIESSWIVDEVQVREVEVPAYGYDLLPLNVPFEELRVILPGQLISTLSIPQ